MTSPATARPAALLWDMDGTLVDTEPYWVDTEFAMAEKYGGTWSHEHAMNLVGNALLDSADYIRAHMGIDRSREEIVEELLDGVVARVEESVPWRPGGQELLDVTKNTGLELTDSMAMWPGAAVSGWYFSHPQSQYFVVGRIAKDQVADYAERKGWTMAEAERWLSPNLGYEPES